MKRRGLDGYGANGKRVGLAWNLLNPSSSLTPASSVPSGANIRMGGAPRGALFKGLLGGPPACLSVHCYFLRCSLKIPSLETSYLLASMCEVDKRTPISGHCIGQLSVHGPLRWR
ncbi:hypothetical protein LOAG_10731 [Loa loa]|uniref:Uncharacterized protein n=1 Tax=Loa loa TaxID=7209 RepID=A0A1S0TQV3_LOALO|nr:hypothetical protein LOAG_10731 [Loa loa]EFO17766.1 hypothetical protein LOAG_10731 [Loa loa]